MNQEELIKVVLSAILGGAPADQGEGASLVGRTVLVRGRLSGVHYGTLKSQGRDYIELEGSRRIWSWKGAFSLSEVSQTGPSAARVAEAVPRMIIPVTDVGEIIEVSSAAKVKLDEQGSD